VSAPLQATQAFIIIIIIIIVHTVVFVGDVWLSEYDPLHIMLRAVYRREIQQSADRYMELYVCLQLFTHGMIFFQ